MQSHLFRSVVVVSLVLAGAFLFATAAGSGGTLVMTINTAPIGVYAGGTISGTATDLDAGIVEVRMYIDGVLIAEDTTMTGEHNTFEFGIPPDAEGKNLKIVAVSDQGNEVIRRFKVGPPR